MLPVVILAAGRGVRLGELSRQYRKVQLPIGDTTLLEQHLAAFSAVGARSFVLVIDPDGSDLAAHARHLAAGHGANLEVVVQRQARGIGQATLLTEQRIGHSPFVLVLGDTYYVPADLAGAVRRFEAGSLDALLSTRPVDSADLIQNECTIDVQDGLVRRIVEKPRTPLSWLKPCGVYFFAPSLLDALRATPASALRGEVELTDAIQTLIAGGGRVGIHESVSFDVNITRPSDVLRANLDWLSRRSEPSFVHTSAVLEPGVRLRSCLVGEGARVGCNAQLVQTVVFPGAAVPNDARIDRSLFLPGIGAISTCGGHDEV
jgi:glucose-1-phosphate thymidylyltransferase